MTASTAKSTSVTSVQANSNIVTGLGGNLKILCDSASIATTSIDEAADIVLLLPLPTSAVLYSLKLFNTDMDTHSTPTLAVDIGLAHCVGTGTANGTQVDVDLFASAITTLQAANLTGVELMFESGDNTLLEVGKPLWELAGAASDPGGYYCIQMKINSTSVAATPAAGTILLQAIFA